jgi:hypothetical protein
MNSQLHIIGAANKADKARIERILASAASQFIMVDTTATSSAPDTICSYSESEEDGFIVGARVVAQSVIIDFSAGTAASLRFLAVEEYISSELRYAFGRRVVVPKEWELMDPKHTLPFSDAAREVARQRHRI